MGKVEITNAGATLSLSDGESHEKDGTAFGFGATAHSYAAHGRSPVKCGIVASHLTGVASLGGRSSGDSPILSVEVAAPTAGGDVTLPGVLLKPLKHSVRPRRAALSTAQPSPLPRAPPPHATHPHRGSRRSRACRVHPVRAGRVHRVAILGRGARVAHS